MAHNMCLMLPYLFILNGPIWVSPGYENVTVWATSWQLSVCTELIEWLFVHSLRCFFRTIRFFTAIIIKLLSHKSQLNELCTEYKTNMKRTTSGERSLIVRTNIDPKAEMFWTNIDPKAEMLFLLDKSVSCNYAIYIV